jgi:hypothetical protein
VRGVPRTVASRPQGVRARKDPSAFERSTGSTTPFAVVTAPGGPARSVGHAVATVVVVVGAVVVEVVLVVVVEVVVVEVDVVTGTAASRSSGRVRAPTTTAVAAATTRATPTTTRSRVPTDAHDAMWGAARGRAQPVRGP